MQDKKNVISRRTTRHAWPCTLTKQSICPWTCSWKTSSICRAAQNKVQQRKQSKIQITSLFLVNNKPNLIKMLRRLYQREKERLALILSSFVNRLSSANQRSRMNKSFQIWMDQLRLILSANLLLSPAKSMSFKLKFTTKKIISKVSSEVNLGRRKNQWASQCVKSTHWLHLLKLKSSATLICGACIRRNKNLRTQWRNSQSKDKSIIWGVKIQTTMNCKSG